MPSMFLEGFAQFHAKPWMVLTTTVSGRIFPMPGYCNQQSTPPPPTVHGIGPTGKRRNVLQDYSAIGQKQQQQ
jgi:hypothetical protein